MADTKAGWEVEGFIDRLTRRDNSNSERLVLEAISHLRAFSRDCDSLRESNRETAAENEQLRAALKWVLPVAEQGLESARQERLRCGHTFGAKRIGLHDFEFHAMEDAKALSNGERK